MTGLQLDVLNFYFHFFKIPDEGLVWDDSALTITINPMQSDAISEDSSDSENSETDDDEGIIS